MRNSREENQQARPKNTSQEGTGSQTISSEAKSNRETVNEHFDEKGHQARQRPKAGANTTDHQPIRTRQ
jgi:hypothetical protein